MTEKKCLLTDKLRNYVYRHGTELSDDKLKEMGIKDGDSVAVGDIVFEYYE